MFQKAFLVGTHRHSYKPGIPFEILRIVFPYPMPKTTPRASYEIDIGNGEKAYIPLANNRYYKIISEIDLKKGIIPKVDRK